MLFRKHRFQDVANNDDRSFQFGLRISLALFGNRRDYSNRPAAFQNDNLLARLMDLVEDGETSRLEVGRVDCRWF